MAIRTFQGRQGEIRIYDGSTPPKYVSLKFVQMNFVAPLAKSRGVEPIVTTVGGFLHSPTSPEYEQNLYEPSAISFSMWANSDDWNVHRAAFSNIDMADPWQVGSHTWSSTKGRGSLVLFDGSYKATQSFFDEKKKAVDVQVRWKDASNSSGSIIGMRYDETYFPPQSLQLTESPDFVEIRASGLVYGNIEPIGDFSPGVSSI